MPRLLIVMMVCVLLAGCRQQQADLPRLVELDSLIAVAPDSAAALLEAIPDDSLRDPENRAYHALLLTQAKYKAYIPATSDSIINLAVEHYVTKNKGNYDRRIRSLIYKGCVMTELGQPDSAMYWFKDAETAARPDDHANLGYINYRMGRLYQNQNSATNRTIQKYQNSVIHYNQNKDSSRLLLSLMEIGSVYRTENKDSALKYIDQAKRLALELEDTLSYTSCLTNEAYTYYLRDNYGSAKLSAMDALLAGIELTDSAGTMMVAAMSYAKLGQADSASYFCDQMRIPEDSATLVLYYDMCAQICQARHDQLGFLKNIRQSESIAGDLLSRSLQQKLIDTEKDSQLHLAEADSEQAKLQSRFIAILASVLFMFASLLFAFWQKRKKLEAATKQNEINNLYFQLKAVSQRDSDLSRQNEELFQQNDELTRQNQELSQQNEELYHISQELERQVEVVQKDVTTMQDRLDKNQQVIDKKNKRISEMAKASSNLQAAQEMAKKMSKSLEYIAGFLHHFIEKSNELKPSEFMNEFRAFFQATSKDGAVDFWDILDTQVDSLYGRAYQRMLEKHSNLSEKDIKIICMSVLGFSSEMMATCLQHKSGYIDTMKNRIKKKLGINCSIPEYLKLFVEMEQNT